MLKQKVMSISVVIMAFLCKIHSEKIDTDSCYNLSGFVVGVFFVKT